MCTCQLSLKAWNLQYYQEPWEWTLRVNLESEPWEYVNWVWKLGTFSIAKNLESELWEWTLGVRGDMLLSSLFHSHITVASHSFCLTVSPLKVSQRFGFKFHVPIVQFHVPCSQDMQLLFFFFFSSLSLSLKVGTGTLKFWTYWTLIGKFPLGLVHQKRPPQVPTKQCFPCILWKILGLVGGFFWGPTQVED